MEERILMGWRRERESRDEGGDKGFGACKIEHLAAHTKFYRLQT